MNQFTRDIFSEGDENRSVARLLAMEQTDLANAARRWAAISAFYAAVHYVNAWLWEHFQIEPRDHTERRTFVMTIATFKPVAIAYARLQDQGYDARYRIGYQLSSSDLTDLMERDLQAVRTVILQSLNSRP